MTTYGYARVSTTDQHLDAQIEQLTAAGCTAVYSEKISGSKEADDRPQLAALLAAAQTGDVIIVCKADRIARSTCDLLNIMKDLKQRGVGFKALNSPIDTTSTVGKLLFVILGGIAEFERDLLLDRQRDGIERARAAGLYKGRAASATAPEAAEKVGRLLDMGLTKQQAAGLAGVSLASVYRIHRARVAAAGVSHGA